MKLKGILDFSLGNFLCLRGFAPMGDLYDISEADPGFQRDLLKEHEKEMVAFLRDGEFLFFPEVILATTLSPEETDNESVQQLYENIRAGQSFANLKFPDYRIACKVQKTKSGVESRAYDVFQTGTIELNARFTRKLSRIDGNHRLSATPKDKKFRAHNTPFCLLLFRNVTEAAKFSRALFHNINYKSVPLTMEQNLALILDDADLFPDEKLKTHEFFGWPYYHARKLYEKLDHDYLPNLSPILKDEPRTFLLHQFEFLISRGILKDNEKAIKLLKEALSKVNSLFDTSPSLKDSTNRGLLSALVYFQLAYPSLVPPFARWVISNHLHHIPESNAADLIAIFEKVMASRQHTIFVSMPFGKTDTENHFTCITEVVAAINRDYPDLRPSLTLKRVDFHTEGVSYSIRAKIDDFMANCGLLIANLTHFNPNVYHEVGFMDGKARSENLDFPDVLLFLDESGSEESQEVGFNLRGSSQIRFKRIDDFKEKLRKNLEKHFKLQP